MQTRAFVQEIARKCVLGIHVLMEVLVWAQQEHDRKIQTFGTFFRQLPVKVSAGRDYPSHAGRIRCEVARVQPELERAQWVEGQQWEALRDEERVQPELAAQEMQQALPEPYANE